MSESQNLSKLKLVELKKMCKEAGLPVTGSKAELVTRLEASMAESADNTTPDDSALLEDDAVLADDSAVIPEPTESKSQESVPVQHKKAEEVAAPKTSAVSIKTMSAEERLAQRQQRFGMQSEDAKKSARAARFGLPTSNGASKASAASIKASSASADLEKLKARGERFGTNVSTQIKKLSQEDALKKRAERFGGGTGGASTQGTKRLNSSSSSDDVEAKKKARAARFGLTA